MFVARTEAELAAALVERPPVCAALGTFDGVHLGHQALLSRAQTLAAQVGGVSLGCTFYPHPKRVVRPDAAPPALESLATRLRRFEAMRMDGAYVIDFTESLAATPAEAFVEQLLGRAMGAKAVVVGENFRFGHGRAGTLDVLRAVGRKLGFEVVVVPAVLVGGGAVSSSRVRALVAAGELEAAARLLGRPVELAGTVVHGDARGRTLGYPTANLACDGDVLPPLGIYAGTARTPHGEFATAISIGVHPTFTAALAPKVEAYLIEYPGKPLYDQPMALTLLARLRGEEKFADVPSLLAQMHLDVEQANAIAQPSLTPSAARAGLTPDGPQDLGPR